MRGLVNFLASLKLTLTVLLLIAAACIVGTLFPQGADVMKYLEANPGAQARMDLLGFLGLTNVFYCWWFILMLCLLSVSLSICTYRRMRSALRRKSGLRWKDLGSLFTHISLLLILGGGVIRGVWGQKGYIAFSEGETLSMFQDGSGDGSGMAKLPFEVHLVDFEIEFYGDEGSDKESKGAISEAVLVIDHGTKVVAQVPAEVGKEQFVGPMRLSVLKKIPDFVVNSETGDIVSRSDEMRNPALLLEVVEGGVTNSQWLFAMYPGFNMHGGKEQGASHYNFRYEVYVKAETQPMVKDYKSTLVILDDGVEVQKKTIEVNRPLSYKGYTFYQSGFNPDDHKWTSLQVVKDPGVPMVYLGFLLMIIGLAMVFYVNPELNVKTAGKVGTN